jgi:hypothetical protein
MAGVMRFRVLALDHDSTIARAGGSARRRESGDSSRRYLLPGLVELTGFETRDPVCHSLNLQLRDQSRHRPVKRPARWNPGGTHG